MWIRNLLTEKTLRSILPHVRQNSKKTLQPLKHYIMRKYFTLIFILIYVISFGQESIIDDLWKLYNSQEFKSVIEKAKPLLENEPNNTDLNLIVGRTYAHQANYSKAILYLKVAAENDKNDTWRKAWALNYLGTCCYMIGEYDDSKQYLKECIALNATKNSRNDAIGKNSLFGFHKSFNKWKYIETENFRFYFQEMDDNDIKNYTELREEAYVEINNFFESTLPKKIDFFVWKSRRKAKRMLKKDLGFAYPVYCITHSHYEQTIGHEMTHIISHYATNISHKNRFIDEGTAVCFDQSHQDRLKQVKDWIEKNNKRITVKDYWENVNNHSDEIVYPLAGLFVKELIDNFGRDKFIEFFCNQTYENAKLVFGVNLDKVIKEFENKINK